MLEWFGWAGDYQLPVAMLAAMTPWVVFAVACGLAHKALVSWKAIYIATYLIALVAVTVWGGWLLFVTMPFFMVSNLGCQHDWGIVIDRSPEPAPQDRPNDARS